MLETTDNICQLRDTKNNSSICQLCDDDICQLCDDCQLCYDDDTDEDEESLYELERDEYYENVLAPQLSTLNRR